MPKNHGPGPRDPRGARGFADVAPEAVLLGGAGAAILLQLADPRVGRGVAEHSNFASQPLPRLWATLDYVYAVALGDPRLRAAQVAHVTRAHDRVNGPASAEHPAYDAHDDDARVWVAMTLAWAGTRAWEAALGPLPAATQDEVVRGYGGLASSLGVPPGQWFASRAEFDAAFNSRVRRLRVSDQARAVARELLAAKAAPLWLRAAMPAARLATAALLPAPVRQDFGLSYGPGRDRIWRGALAGVNAVYPRLPVAVRQAPAWWRISAQGKALSRRQAEGKASRIHEAPNHPRRAA